MSLSVKFVERQSKPGRFHDGDGLYLQVQVGAKTGKVSKSWLFRYERGGKERMMGLGKVSIITLDEAREQVRSFHKMLLQGVDPYTNREKEKQARALEAARQITFEQASKTYHQQNEGRWRNQKSRDQWLSKMRRFAWPVLGTISVAEVDVGLVLKVLERPYKGQPLWLALPSSSSRLRQGIEQVLAWAKVRGYRTGDNPAALGLLQHALPARPAKNGDDEHHPALPWSQLPEFMAELRAREGTAARGLEFAILTTARTAETIGARWTEIDFAAKTWTVPGARMKNGREHKVPLSPRAIEILETLPRFDDNPFCFVGDRNDKMSNGALRTLLDRMNDAWAAAGKPRWVDPKQGNKDVTPHGFRSSFRDWVGEATSFPEALAEAALAHKKGDKVEEAYKRGTMFAKRAKLMEAWAGYCSAAPAKADNVVPMRAAQ